MSGPAPPLWELTGRSPGDEALRDATRSLTWAELDGESNAVGHGLDRLGLTPGAHVALVAGNRAGFVTALLGAQRAGYCVTPVKTGWTADEIGYLLADAGTEVVVTDVPAARRAAVAAGVVVVDLDDDHPGWLAAQPDSALPADRCGSRMSYTSGTTGRPKGVVRHGDGTRPFVESFPGLARWARALGIPGDHPHLVVAQLFHGAPLTFGLAALAAGAPLRILDRWDPRAALAGLAGGVGSSCLVPSMFRELLGLPGAERAAHDVSGVVALVHGGEPCPPELKRRMLDWFGPVLVEYYGFTEGGMTVASAQEWLERPGTVGRPLGAARIVVLDDDGRPQPPGEVGTVYAALGVDRPFVYRNAPEKTAAAYHGDAITAGDHGWVDEDGYLYLCGRSADVIVSAGVNLYPAQIEAALGDVPELADLCVVAGPHAVRGEQPVAFVVPAAGVDPGRARAALATAAASLGSYQRPREILVRAALPRDGTGKLQRHVLQDELWVGVERFAVARGSR